MDKLAVGRIVKPQGIKGEVKIVPLTDDPARFNALQQVLLEGEEKPRRLHGARNLPNGVFLTLEGVLTREQAEALRGKLLFIDRADAVPLAPGRYFIADLENTPVFDEQGEKIGKVAHVLQLPANDVLEVATSKGYRYIPFVGAFIGTVEPGKGITVNTALLEEETVPE